MLVCELYLIMFERVQSYLLLCSRKLLLFSFLLPVMCRLFFPAETFYFRLFVNECSCVAFASVPAD